MYRFLVLILLLCSAASASADMYKYTDDSGTVCMTNSLESVPKKFRSKMTIIKDDTPKPAKLLPEAQKPEPSSVTRNESVQEQAEQQARTDKSRYINTSLVIAGIIAGFFVLRWLGNKLGFPRVGTLMFLIVTILGGVYLYRLYVSELNNVFGTLKKDAMNIKKNVETRDQKTDQMLKQQLEKDKLD